MTVGRHAVCPRKVGHFKNKISHFGNFFILDTILRLRIIAKKVLREFWQKHSDCEQQLKSWFQETSNAEWKTTKDIKVEYPTVRFLADNRVIFNIKGNHHRLTVKINYNYQMVWIRFIGTHAEYEKIDALNI